MLAAKQKNSGRKRVAQNEHTTFCKAGKAIRLTFGTLSGVTKTFRKCGDLNGQILLYMTEEKARLFITAMRCRLDTSLQIPVGKEWRLVVAAFRRWSVTLAKYHHRTSGGVCTCTSEVQLIRRSTQVPVINFRWLLRVALGGSSSDGVVDPFFALFISAEDGLVNFRDVFALLLNGRAQAVEMPPEFVLPAQQQVNIVPAPPPQEFVLPTVAVQEYMLLQEKRKYGAADGISDYKNKSRFVRERVRLAADLGTKHALIEFHVRL